MDFTADVSRPTSVQEVNDAFRAAASVTFAAGRIRQVAVDDQEVGRGRVVAVVAPEGIETQHRERSPARLVDHLARLLVQPVVDAPTAYVNVLIGQAENGLVVGQFPEQGEQFGLVFELDNPLVECVNIAIGALEADGTLQALEDEWLAVLTYPVLQ